MLSQSQNITVRQQQQLEQTMTPQQMQGLKILQMPSTSLEQFLGEQLVQNPVLEVQSSGQEILESDYTSGKGDRNEAEMAEDRRAELIDYDETLVRSVGESVSDIPYDDYLPTASHRNPDLEAEEKRKYFFDSIRAEKNLSDLLYEQIEDLAGGDDRLIELCQQILGNIDNSGYLRASDEDIGAQTHAGPAMVARAVKLLQNLEPAGFAARDLRECLLLQLARKGKKDSLSWRIVSDSLEDLGRNHIPQLARRYGVPLEEVQKSAEEIRQLSPRPGSVLFAESAPVVAPDVFIEKNDDGIWTVRLNRDVVPVVALSSEYAAMLNDPNVSDETKSFLRGKLTEGQQLIWAVDQRMSTIEKISVVLLNRQKDFFDRGPMGLHPLTLVQIAEVLDLHEATISRAIANKFLNCSWGTFPFKYFFSAGFRSEGGEEVSSRAIQKRIADLIAAENHEKPLSDQKLADLLKEEGLEVARRTVAKYREAQGLPAASLRRVHG